MVADEYVDMEFGTGAVKITPAHDPNDFEVAARHDLKILKVLSDDGRVNENGGKYNGQDRYEARKNIIEELKKTGLLVKTEDHKHNVGQCYRCATVVEPIVSKQWFVSMKQLAEPAIRVVRDKTVQFMPERFDKIYFNWMENIRDWCISRQLWWGHRIPAYYCDDCGETMVAKLPPEKCTKCGSKNIRQDEDVLDTWFSSGLWPFSTLGWPDGGKDLDFFYPTSVLVTAYDIIFFWVARMIVFGMEVMGKEPFHTVCIHGIVRDEQGRKMSKSLDNGIDPLEVIEKYGADALRFSLAAGNSPGGDMRFYWEKVESARNFANKIWNASRFVLMNIKDGVKPIDNNNLDIADKWILSRLNRAIKEVTNSMEKYELGLAAQKVYDFMWSEFCDWYIEMAKPRLYGEDQKDRETALSVLTGVLSDTLKLLHPFMPFITEEIYTYLPGSGESIMISDWPQSKEQCDYKKEEEKMQGVMELIRSVRNIRAQMNVAPSKQAQLVILAGEKSKDAISGCRAYVEKLAYASDITFIASADQAPKNAVTAVCETAEVFMPLEDLVDVQKEIERLTGEKEKIAGEIKRAKR